jgi:hypothetical protein
MASAYREILNAPGAFDKFLEITDFSRQPFTALAPVIKREDGAFSIDVELLERVTQFFRKRIANLFSQNTHSDDKGEMYQSLFSHGEPIGLIVDSQTTNEEVLDIILWNKGKGDTSYTFLKGANAIDGTPNKAVLNTDQDYKDLSKIEK